MGGDQIPKLIPFKELKMVTWKLEIVTLLVNGISLNVTIFFSNLFLYLAVNWEEIASNINYPIPARETREVGRYLAELIDYLCQERGADPRRFHLIGHSLGAHIAGFAGSFIRSGRIGRISGKLTLFSSTFILCLSKIKSRGGGWPLICWKIENLGKGQ